MYETQQNRQNLPVYVTKIGSIRRQAATVLSYLLLFYAAIFLYIIPYIIPDLTIPRLKIFLPIFIVFLLFELLDKKIKLYTLDLLLILIILLSSLFNFYVEKVGDAIVISILLLTYKKQQIFNKTFLLIIYLFSAIAIIGQLLVYRDEVENTIILAVGDPNFSGLIMLLFFFFCWKNRFILGVVLSVVCAFLFVSRAYFLALAIFFVLFFLERINSQTRIINGLINLFSQKSRFFLILIVANLSLLFFSIYFLNYIEVQTGYKPRDLSRLQRLNDNSNLTRFTSNYVWLNLIQKDSDIALFGVPSQYNDEDELNKFFKSLGSRVVPHNSLFHIIAQRGILFCLVYFLIIDKILNKTYKKENFKYILAYLVFALFLHAAYGGPRLIFLIITLALPESKFKSKFKLSKQRWKSLS